MSLHDAYARLTPFELVLPGTGAMAEFVRVVGEEADRTGADTGELFAFMGLNAADALVTEVAGREAEAPTLHPLGELAFHSYHFAVADASVFVLSAQAARYLVEGAPAGDPRPPTRSGYLQLPQHLFWAADGGGAPESIDGVIWTVATGDVLRVMLVTGMRPDRPGMGATLVPEAPLTDASIWMNVRARGDERDFDSEIPGAEIDGLYEIRTAGEALKLLARFFAYAGAVPEALEQRPPADGDDVVAAGGPAPSSFAHVRVILT